MPPVACDDDAQHERPSLLHLPNALLAHALGHLSNLSDLAAVAATCSALRSLVAEATWQHVSHCAAHVWSPALPGSLSWAAARCPQARIGARHAAHAYRLQSTLPGSLQACGCDSFVNNRIPFLCSYGNLT